MSGKGFARTVIRLARDGGRGMVGVFAVEIMYSIVQSTVAKTVTADG